MKGDSSTVDFAFSEKQEALRTAARRYLADRFLPARALRSPGSSASWDPASWTDLSTLGWFDTGVGPLEHAVLAEETGYALYPGPVWTTLALAQPACAGRVRLNRPTTLAWRDDDISSLADAERAHCVAEQTSDGWRLSGVKRQVPDADRVEDAIVVAQGPDGVGLWRVDLTAHREAVLPLSTLDSSRWMAELRLDHTPAELLVPPADTPIALVRVRRTAQALLACEAVGVAQRALDIASTQTRPSVRAGHGGYPGVSHRIANMYTALQLARSLAYRAAWCVTRTDRIAEQACATATVSAGHVVLFTCENAIVAVGGIGYSDDHPLRRLHQRARWINAFEGFPGARQAGGAPQLVESS